MGSRKCGELSYGYWHGKGGGDAPIVAPQRIVSPEGDEAATRAPGTSAWNAAGTWEERDWTSWAKARLSELCCEVTVTLPSGVGELCVKQVKTCTGDATVVVVRGVPRTGFDFDVTLSWGCQLGGDEERTVTGTASLPDASRSAVGAGECADGISYSFSIDKQAKLKLAAVEEAALKEGGKLLRQRLFDVLRQLDEEMQQKLALTSR